MQGRIFIESLLNDTLIGAGLSERDEVLEINGVNVIDYGRRNIMPYVSTSTQQELLNRTYTNELLSGSEDEALASPANGQFEVRSCRGGILIEINNASLAVLGYKPEELKGKKLLDLLYEDDKSNVLAALQDAERGLIVSLLTNNFYHKAGHILTIAWTITWDEEEACAFCIGRDDTDRSLSLEQLEKQKRILSFPSRK